MNKQGSRSNACLERIPAPSSPSDVVIGDDLVKGLRVDLVFAYKNGTLPSSEGMEERLQRLLDT